MADHIRLPDAYGAVLDDLQDYLATLDVPAKSRTAVADAITGPDHIPVNYDVHAPAFAHLYAPTNYCKAAAVLEADPPSPEDTVADLGCGPGAATLAYLTWRDAHGYDGAVDAALVDRSRAQLALARDLLDTCSPVAVDTTRLEGDLTAYTTDTDVVLMGHVLTEQRDRAQNLLDHAENAARHDCRVVERVGDPVWDALDAEPDTVRLQRYTDDAGEPVETSYLSR